MDNNDNKHLSDLKTGETGIILKVSGHGAFRKRITEMGFVKGKVVEVVKKAPLLDPVEYKIMNYNVSLRNSEAAMIEVVPVGSILEVQDGISPSMLSEEVIQRITKEKGNNISIALVGNPNCGKTTLFNNMSGLHEKVGNYSGVTVDAKEATIHHNGYTLKVTDLPGTYSITEYTPEELYVRTHITDKMPDVVINVIDASNLERNLFLTTQLIDMNIKVVIALNMYDELRSQGMEFKYEELAGMIGIPIIPTVATKGKGVDALLEKAIDVAEDRDHTIRHFHIYYGNTLEGSIEKIQDKIRLHEAITDKYSTRYLAIKLLEGDNSLKKELEHYPNYEDIALQCLMERKYLKTEYGDDPENVLTDAKYGFIAGALKETLVYEKKEVHKKAKDPDNILTHRIWGFPIFLLFLWVMFQGTFTLGSYPMEWLDKGVGLLGDYLSTHIPEGWLNDLISDGIIGGVGGVLIFLPNILILFFFMSFMEDTGYMARVSFIMDKFMHTIGLHGKSFIPLIMGFGCNVPAIMSTRTLESRNDRVVTMLMIPFMSCSARMPVYVLMISAFFAKHQGMILFSIYIIGIIMSILLAIILKNTVFTKQDIPFVMELPPYRMPTLKTTTLHMWHKGAQYLKKMGTFIMLASIIIWLLSYFPREVSYSQDYDVQISSLTENISIPEVEKNDAIATLELAKNAEHQEKSYIGQVGKFIEPVIRPLGFDWKIGVSIISGLAAKEIVVSTMGVLYNAGTDATEDDSRLIERLQQHGITPLTAYCFMLFVLLYFPCIATITAIAKESSWKIASFSMIYTTGVAWLVSFLVFQVGNLII